MLYDISPALTPSLAIWPGDVPISRIIQTDIVRGDLVTLSSLQASCHIGSHADAPSHISGGGKSIEQCDLKYYLGPCQVIRVQTNPSELVTWEMVASAMALETDPQGNLAAPRILIATGTYGEPERFTSEFAGLHPTLIDMLHEKGVFTVGVDTPSVDLFNSEALEAHRACYANSIAILEGLQMQDVPAGKYELIALPLKLVGFDASPVRAVLRTLTSQAWSE